MYRLRGIRVPLLAPEITFLRIFLSLWPHDRFHPVPPFTRGVTMYFLLIYRYDAGEGEIFLHIP